MREPWRFTYTFTNAELLEHMRSIRRGTLEAVTFMLRREVLLQASERGLIQLPANTVMGDCHLIKFCDITVLNEAINTDDNTY